MNKQEFIDNLRRNLSSLNDYHFVNDTISYYENYIETEIRMGKTEAQVMEELGDPRLIAKSIRATHESEESGDSNSYREFEEDAYSANRGGLNNLFRLNNRIIKMPAWLVKAIVITVVLFVFFIIFTVLRWLSPFIFVGMIVWFIYRNFLGK